MRNFVLLSARTAHEEEESIATWKRIEEATQKKAFEKNAEKNGLDDFFHRYLSIKLPKVKKNTIYLPFKNYLIDQTQTRPLNNFLLDIYIVML